MKKVISLIACFSIAVFAQNEQEQHQSQQPPHAVSQPQQALPPQQAAPQQGQYQYPPPQQAYPPPQGQYQYPPPQQAYPPPQGQYQYPPPQQAYPPPQQAYPPPQQLQPEQNCAQEPPGIRYGVRAGLNLSSVTLDDQDFSLGWQIGAVADIGSKYFFFNPGIIFIGKGTGYSKNDVETTSSMYYIEAPLLLSFKPIPEFRINVGHYVSYGLFGTTETKGISETQKTFDFLDEFDFGLSFGVGVEIMKYYVGLNYEFGLIDIREDKDELERMEGYKETKNQTWALTFGYYF